MKNTCNVCSTEDNHPLFLAKEMLYGTRDEFNYFKCSNCGCLQITEIPGNIGDYYPKDYYSFSFKNKSRKNQISAFLLRKAIRKRFGHFSLMGLFAELYNPYYKTKWPWLTKDLCTFDSKILDVGCGAGSLLMSMHQWGFKNLTGIDPFIDGDKIYSNSVSILKKDIYAVNEKYNLIMLHHSFEHMSNPNQVFSKLNDCLSDKGILLVCIPIVDSYLWRKYKMDWFQVDVPRHLFLHSKDSVAYLAKENGFRIKNTIFDAEAMNYLNSENYSQGIAYNEEKPSFTEKEIKYFKDKTSELNSRQDGDQACFVLEKLNSQTVIKE